MATSNELIRVESLVHWQDGTPAVRLRWGNEIGDLTPTEARAHALVILECAEAAEMDAIIYRWLRDRVNADPSAAVKLLADFRQLRGEIDGGSTT